jgi:para-nitrobenzyl esterase
MSDSARQPVVRLADGAVRGTTVAGVSAFLGIPYAAAPFGANRMRAPQPVAPWDGEREATAFGPTVPKGDYPPAYVPLFPEVVIPGEECLNLNVWTPDLGAAGLPVLVWIHGGSFMNGSSSVGEYDGAAFARDGVVCVSINYRLAAEGFLFLDDGIVNLGLLDQLAALGWVQRNIGAFGGDPARVTVAGESAGAMSVTTLLSMPLAAGLFAQAIAESGAGAHTLTVSEARMVGEYLASALGVPAERSALAGVPLDKLVKAASDLVVEVQTAPDPARWGSLALSLLPFAPVVDGSVLPAAPLSAFTSGQGGEVPLLIGSNRDEARLFLVAAGTIDLIDAVTLGAVAGAYGLSEAGVSVYAANRPSGSAGDVLAAVITDWFFRVPAVRVAEARFGAGRTWMYRFDYPPPSSNYGLGSCHGAEIPFVFDTLGLPSVRPRLGSSPSQAVADLVHRVWVSFVTSGSPGWAAYDAARRTTGLLAEDVTPVDDPAGDERALWEGIRLSGLLSRAGEFGAPAELGWGLVVEELLDAAGGERGSGHGLELAAGEGPGHQGGIADRVRVVGGAGDDQQGAAFGDQAGEGPDGGGARRAVQGLDGVDLGDQVERALPLGGRGEQVGDLVVDRFVGEPLSGLRDGRWRYVEGGDLAAEIGQEGGVAADAAADYEGAAAESGDAAFGRGLSPLG